MNENNFNTINLDFVKMNETLANSEFANWYYHEVIDNNKSDMNLENFIKLVQEHTDNQFK